MILRYTKTRQAWMHILKKNKIIKNYSTFFQLYLKGGFDNDLEKNNERQRKNHGRLALGWPLGAKGGACAD